MTKGVDKVITVRFRRDGQFIVSVEIADEKHDATEVCEWVRRKLFPEVEVTAASAAVVYRGKVRKGKPK